MIISNTSINERVSFNQLEVFPNPVSTSVNIHLPAGVFTVTVFDKLGKTVKTIGPAQGAIEVDLGGLANGVYLINVTNDMTLMKAKVFKH